MSHIDSTSQVWDIPAFSSPTQQCRASEWTEEIKSAVNATTKHHCFSHILHTIAYQRHGVRRMYAVFCVVLIKKGWKVHQFSSYRFQVCRSYLARIPYELWLTDMSLSTFRIDWNIFFVTARHNIVHLQLVQIFCVVNDIVIVISSLLL